MMLTLQIDGQVLRVCGLGVEHPMVPCPGSAALAAVLVLE